MAKSLSAADVSVVRQSSGTVTPFNDFDPTDRYDEPNDPINDGDPHHLDWVDW